MKLKVLYLAQQPTAGPYSKPHTPTHILPTHLFKKHCNVILPATPPSSE